jgi:hypothetical protein
MCVSVQKGLISFSFITKNSFARHQVRLNVKMCLRHPVNVFKSQPFCFQLPLRQPKVRLHVCCLLNDALSSFDGLASDCRMIKEIQLKSMWKEEVLS